MSTAPEEEWNNLLLEGITVGKGEVVAEELYGVIKKRIERTLIRTVSSVVFYYSLCLLLPPSQSK